MTNDTKNVPELRFPGFSGEWEIKELGNRVKFYSGLTYTPNDVSKNGTLVLRSSNIFNNHIINADNVYVNSDKATSTYVEYGDVVVVVRNGSRNLIGKHAVIKNEESNAVIGAFMTGIRYEFGSFINALLSTQNFQKEIHKNLGATINQITTGIFKKMTFYFPKKQEEQKIGEFFSKLDRQIELEEQKLEKLEEQKKGYMQKIFSQELRFKDENGNTFEEWKNTNFNYFMSEPDNLEKGIDLRKDQLLTVKLEGNGVSKANINRALKMGSTVYYKRFAGQFIYGKQNFFNGAFGIVPKFLNNYYSSGDVPALNIDYSKIDSKYFINYISRKDYYKKKEAFSTGTGSKRIHEKTLLDFDIMLPSVEEQEKIGDFFSEIDNFIEKQSYKVELLKERKKGFLQKMFV
ncbi:restriction endonuclease subunit S [Staphylococcus arlettae]|uniref:restriction endonuclease subunit S n=1 Tax=Staphylococcus arlettae TaxID=29378 RepID=UPI000D1BB8FD|nr:restriction endonuclease subunit S [Staphylococcus arlettae]PTH34700.1 restriction endonuclease subunit S [Staphylococcus arlettae]